MHDPTAQGSAFFKCDFCHKPWDEDRPMVEGHKGSLVCSQCLTLAFDELWNRSGGDHPTKGTPAAACVMCLEERDDPYWVSAAFPDVGICKRCVKQAVVMLERDPDAEWKRPPASA